MIKGLVSVIVPVYNVEKHLRKCIDSILLQTYSNIEIILIDDGSIDASGEICDEYAEKDARIRIFHKKNEGVSKARNMGLDLHQGEFVSFVDSDDTIDKSFVERMVDEMLSNDVDLVRFSWYRGNEKKTYFAPFDLNGKFIVDLFNLGDLLWFANIWGLFRSECINNVRFDEQMKYAEDNLFVFEYFVKSKTKRMILLNTPLYHYSVTDGSATCIDMFDRLEKSKLFLEKINNLNLIGVNLNEVMNQYIYKDYLALYYYFVDKKISSEKGYSVRSLKNKIDELRSVGCREYTLNEKIVSAMYRNHFHFLLKLFRKARSFL